MGTFCSTQFGKRARYASRVGVKVLSTLGTKMKHAPCTHTLREIVTQHHMWVSTLRIGTLNHVFH